MLITFEILANSTLKKIKMWGKKKHLFFRFDFRHPFQQMFFSAGAKMNFPQCHSVIFRVKTYFYALIYVFSRNSTLFEVEFSTPKSWHFGDDVENYIDFSTLVNTSLRGERKKIILRFDLFFSKKINADILFERFSIFIKKNKKSPLP